MKKYYYILLIVVLSAIAGSVIYWRSQRQIVLPATQPVANEAKSETDTSNWQTYRNGELGFEIKYPNDWIIQPNKESISVIYNGKRENNMDTADMTIRLIDISLEKFIEGINNEGKMGDQQITEVYQNEPYTIGNISARKLSSTTDIGIDAKDIFIEKGGKNYLLSYFEPFDINLKKTLFDIIATFKFLD